MNVYISGNMAAMRGPCPEGFHVPSVDEWDTVNNIGISLGLWTSKNGTNVKTYLKLPLAGMRTNTSATDYQGTAGFYWSCDAIILESNLRHCGKIFFVRDSLSKTSSYSCSCGNSIRPFKDIPVIPDSSWAALYSDKIYHNSTLGLISLSSDGTNWITISDKNLGATTIYNNGDTLSEANCGKYYQRGNNYGFAWTGSVTTSSTLVDASSYGPQNYYSSSTFITTSGGTYDWATSLNYNLRGGVSGGINELKNAYIGEYS